MNGKAPENKRRYMFSLTANITAYRIGETSEGYRVDIDYTDGDVTTNFEEYKKSWGDVVPKLSSGGKSSALFKTIRRGPEEDVRKACRNLDWFGLEGKLVSGSDWLLVRNDGVAEFNGRMTLQEEIVGKEGGRLINTELAAVVDLWNKERGSRPKGHEVYEAWKASRGDAALDFWIALRFKLAEASQPWAGAEFRTSAGFWRYESLPRCQYMANTRVTTTDGLIKGIAFDVWRIAEPTPPFAAAESGTRT